MAQLWQKWRALVMALYVPPGGWKSPEELIAYNKKLDQEAKTRTSTLDTLIRPVVLQDVPHSLGVEMPGQVVDTTKYKYDRIKVRGPDGKARYTASCKDAVAKALYAMTKEQVLKVGRDNDVRKVEEQYKARNSGHFRMMVGQSLRAIIIKGGKVMINGVKITALDQPIEWPKGFVQEDKGTPANPIRKQASAHRIDD